MSEQMSMFARPKAERTDLVKRRWENAFQRWSDKNGMSNGETDYGACGCGSMCDWCEDNSYGRPCVRALNAMCRDKGYLINYAVKDFEGIWRGKL